MAITLTGEEALVVCDPAGFQVVVDAKADDPISRSLRGDDRPRSSFLKRWVRRLLKRRRSHAPHLDLMRRLVCPGDCVLDLGAHVGTVSLALAALGCEVAAVEACPRNAALLRAAAKLNHFDRLHVIEAAISDHTGTAAFSPRGPFGHLFSPVTDLPSIPVRAMTVDDLLAELGWAKVAFIKMDIEGSEIAALRGMEQLLARADAPPILYESNAYALGFYGATPRLLREKLEEGGYRSYRADGDQRVLVRPDDPQAEVVVDYLAVKQALDGSSAEGGTP